jgi:hypothetical protein
MRGSPSLAGSAATAARLWLVPWPSGAEHAAFVRVRARTGSHRERLGLGSAHTPAPDLAHRPGRDAGPVSLRAHAQQRSELRPRRARGRGSLYAQADEWGSSRIASLVATQRSRRRAVPMRESEHRPASNLSAARHAGKARAGAAAPTTRVATVAAVVHDTAGLSWVARRVASSPLRLVRASGAPTPVSAPTGGDRTPAAHRRSASSRPSDAVTRSRSRARRYPAPR